MYSMDSHLRLFWYDEPITIHQKPTKTWKTAFTNFPCHHFLGVCFYYDPYYLPNYLQLDEYFAFFVLVKVAMLLNVYILLQQEFHPTLRKNHPSGWFMLAVIIISCPSIIYHVILNFSQTEFTTEEFHSHFFSRIWQTRLKMRHKYSLVNHTTKLVRCSSSSHNNKVVKNEEYKKEQVFLIHECW